MATATPLTKLKKCDLIRLVRSLTKSKKERMFKRNGGRPFEISACNINRITKEQLLSKVYRLQEERKPKAKAKTPRKPTLKPRPKDDTWPIPIVKTDSKGIIKLPGVGNWPAIEFGKIKPGVRMLVEACLFHTIGA